MGPNFRACDREQAMLLPPSLREWLPADHLAWFVLDVVDELDLGAFRDGYRQDGWGRPAFDPALMVALLLYAYAVGERSSRGIERRCREDVAFRVVAANELPDHATIARFRVRHEQALGGVFSQVLRLCAASGLVRVGVVALDGTKIAANAALSANRTYEQIARELLAEAAELDAAEDAQLGAARGDELPAELAEQDSRRARLRAAKERLEAERDAAQAVYEARVEQRERAEAEHGRPLRGRRPVSPPAAVDPLRKANVTDPDSRVQRAPRGYLQGYNAQAVCTEAQLIIAADVSIDSPDTRLLAPMLRQVRRELDAIGISETPGVVLADAGYWNVPQIDEVVATGSQLLVNPVSSGRLDALDQPPRHGDRRRQGLYLHLRRLLQTPEIRALYRRRQQMIEPVFAQTKVTRRADRFQRRGLEACKAEWRLLATTHNLLKLYRHTLRTA